MNKYAKQLIGDVLQDLENGNGSDLQNAQSALRAKVAIVYQLADLTLVIKRMERQLLPTKSKD